MLCVLRLAGVGLLGWALLATGRVEAQGCHAPSFTHHHEAMHPFHASLGLLAGFYDHGAERRGEYQGLYAEAAYRHPWFAASVLLPAYRLTRADDTDYGLGDLLLTASGTLLSARDGDLQLGVQLPVMLPTGDEGRSLGMGHVMPMPAVWFALSLPPFALRAELGYGRALGREHREDEHAGHDAEEHAAASAAQPTPIVNPMNRSELEHAVTLVLGLQKHLRVHARWIGALPIADDDGIVRQIVGGGASIAMHPLDFTSELQVPVAGNPFDVRLLLQLAAMF